MTEEFNLGEAFGQLLGEMRGLNARIDEARTTDGGRKAAATDGAKEVSDQLVALTREQMQRDISEAIKAELSKIRTPSMADTIGQGTTTTSRMRGVGVEPHPALKGLFADYTAGEMLGALLDYKGIGLGGIDVERAVSGKAKLDELGLIWAGVPEYSKATLGTTGATGGYVLPNNIVDTVVKPNVQEALYTGSDPLVTVIPGVAVRGVDQPYRTGAPTRMTFQDWGATKENVDLAYGSYTAYLGTIARIYDIGKQYARFSGGAAERDVVDELTKAAALAENYYVIAGQGTGTGTPGVNDPTVGIYTALQSGANTYKTAFAGASNSTVAGSVAAALAGAMGTLAARSRRPSAVVLDAVTYWQLFSQGSDSAGFFMSSLLGAGFSLDGQNLTWNGIPIRYDANLSTNTATKLAIIGDFKAVKFYRGMEFRIDTSDVAYDRWDKNLIGFRGEEEIGVNASTAVSVGAFQLVTAIIP